MLHKLYLKGASAKEAVAKVAQGETGLKRKELYQAWLKLDKILGEHKNSGN